MPQSWPGAATIAFATSLLFHAPAVAASSTNTSTASDSWTCPSDDEDYGSFWAGTNVNDPNFHLKPQQVMWIVCGLAALLSICVALYNVAKHLQNFTVPGQQVHIVRLLLLPIIYSICSWLAFRFYTKAAYIHLVRDVYEALAIYSFAKLLLQYLGRRKVDQLAYLSSKPRMPHPPPLRCCVGEMNPACPTFLPGCLKMILQFVVVKPIITVVAAVCQALDRFCAESMSPKHFHLWYGVVGLVSIVVCVYGVLKLIAVAHTDIRHHRPHAKFWSIKMVILLLMLQSAILSSLASSGKLHTPNSFFTPSNLANALDSILTCFEMFFLALFHLYAFSHREYLNPDAAKLHFFNPNGTVARSMGIPATQQATDVTAATAAARLTAEVEDEEDNEIRRLSVGAALGRVLNPIDIFRDVAMLLSGTLHKHHRLEEKPKPMRGHAYTVTAFQPVQRLPEPYPPPPERF
ncbi:hypothetical protein HDU96_008052 [Phlyctochytrium bullatum]|nr:hypothetical protein HDU96_008052 [Phlyctochytrium bullatum]